MEINLMAPINDLSYGLVGLNILCELVKNNHEVSLFPIPSVQHIQAEPKYHDIIKKCLKNAELFSYTSPSIRLWHQNQMAESVGSGARFGFPIFELDRFSEVELNHLHSLDRILVCSEWAKKIINDNMTGFLVDNIHVVPLGVDTSIFYPPEQKNNDNVTRFLSMGKWEIRKGHDVLVEIFNKAFEQNDNVELIMHCYNPFINDRPLSNKKWTEIYKNSKLGNKIQISENRDLSLSGVADLMRSVDCGVFLSRAEGWNLELLEMMACAKHVIATNYSGHTEFVNERNCHLVDITEKEIAFDDIWFRGQGNWAFLGKDQIDQTIEYMRLIHSMKQENKLPANYFGLATAQNFTWGNTIKRLVDVLLP